MMSRRLLAHDDGRCRRLRRRHCQFVDVLLAVVVALALLAQQTSGVGGELAAAASRKSRKRHSAVVPDELPPLSTVEDDPYETDADTYSNATSDRRAASGRHRFDFVNPKPDDLQIECKPLKSKRYITDGFCTSIRPVVDFVCTGTCLPIRQLPWYAEFIKVWSHTKTLQYRCVDDVVRHRKVTFACDNGETRSYRIRVVRSCKCKRYMRSQNESPGAAGRGRRRAGSRRRRRRRKMSND